MTIRDELIIRIVGLSLINDNNIIRNYELMQLSTIGKSIWSTMQVTPGSIMRNFRGLGLEFESYLSKRKNGMTFQEWIGQFPAYWFNHKSKTDYHLSKGFVKWLEDECKKLKEG